ncbi:MAG: GNAT family N-acetyltransferase [Actinomycetota bacterium]
MRSRPYEHPRDLWTIQDLVSRTWSPDARWHIGEIAWNRLEHLGREPEWPTRIWEDGDTAVAWGWLRPPGHLDLCVDPAFPALTDDVLSWFESEAIGDELTVTITADEPHQALVDRDYEPEERDRFFLHLRRNLDDLATPALPPGYTLRTVRGEQDVEERVAIHRAAFAPSEVTVESYRAIMGASPYRPDLDCVAEAADGSFVAFCLMWLDERNGVGQMEPVGTHPDHRRLGLGSAVCLEALARLREAGATSAIVAARGDDADPAPRGLYMSIGFREHTHNVRYRRLRYRDGVGRNVPVIGRSAVKRERRRSHR